MSSHGSIFSKEEETRFYKNVTSLHKISHVPANEHIYGPNRSWESDRYLLSYDEELYIADSFALLAQTEHGGRYVSAVAVEEARISNGLVLRLAANTKPSSSTLEGIEKVLTVLGTLPWRGKHRQDFLADLFSAVIELSSKRILQRLRLQNSARDAGKPPLHIRLRQIERRLSAILGMPSEMKQVCINMKRLGDMTESHSSQRPHIEDMEVLKSAVRCSLDVVNSTGGESLEGFLKSKGCDQMIFQDPCIIGIDKLAKYLSLCKTFVRYSRDPRLCTLLSNTTLALCPVPIGTRKECFIHGEVQLIFHYERYPHSPPPRAIGSSKSACYLCDLIIKHHGIYHVSSSHGHLHPKWTIPVANWMSNAKIQKFRTIMNKMNHEIRHRLDPRSGRRRVVYASESRVQLFPYQYQHNNTSIVTELSRIDESNINDPTFVATSPRISPDDNSESSAETPVLEVHTEDYERATNSQNSMSVSSDISLTYRELPYSQLIDLETPNLHLQIGSMAVSFHFLQIFSGRIDVTQNLSGAQTNEANVLDVSGIPSEHDIRIDCPLASDTLQVELRKSSQSWMRIVFKWLPGTSPIDGLDAPITNFVY